MEDNKEQQENEILAISSICTSLKHDDKNNRYTLLLRPDSEDAIGGEATDDYEDPDSLIHFTFSPTPGYPSSEPPVLSVKSACFLPEHCELLVTKLRELWSPNELIIFQCIQWLQSDAIPTINQYIESNSKSKRKNIYHLNKNSSNINSNNNNNNNVNLEDEIEQLQIQQQRIKSNIPTPTIYTGQAITDKKSKFQAHLAIVKSEEEVQLVLEQLMTHKKIAEATHNMYAFRIKMPNGQMNEYCDDDGEAGAGDKMLFTLIKNQSEEIMVVVTRWFGGILLGGARYQHIINVTKEMLTLYQNKQLNTCSTDYNNKQK